MRIRAIGVVAIVAAAIALLARRGDAPVPTAVPAATPTIDERVSRATRPGRWSDTRIEETVERTADGAERVVARRAMVADHLVVAFRAGLDADAVARVASAHGATVRERLVSDAGNLWLIAFDASRAETLHRLERELGADPAVAYAEPDPLVDACATPDDPNWTKCWGLDNTGQTGGTPGADVKATGAWSVCTGSSSVKIAMIDSGITFSHADLAANCWINPGETGLDAQGRDKRTNGVDDDGDGYVDDWRGWDFVNGDNDPTDDHGHGTHTSGIAGACGGNATGIAGVCWHVSLMPLKFLAKDGTAPISAAIAALDYAAKHGAKVASLSWGTGTNSQAFHDAIVAAGKAGVLLCVAAGNSNFDVDKTAFYPSTWRLPNVLSVMSTDANDAKASFSCFGLTTVQLAAPGVNVYSTTRNGAYDVGTGTSVSVPHVSGAIALLASYRPDLGADELRARVLAAVDPLPALAGKCQSGGRLNVSTLIARAKPTTTPTGTAHLRIDADDAYDQLYVDGVAQSVGANAADYRLADTVALPVPTESVALRCINDQPGTGWAGVCAKLSLPDGTTRVSDASWRVWTRAGAPPDDARGRHWWQSGYDDTAWSAATEQGAYGCAPWGAPAGTAGLEGARWIWAGDPAHGPSPAYLRWDFVAPAASADVVWLDVDDACAELVIDGVAVALGPHASQWTTADRYDVREPLECIALRATNGQPGSGYAGLIARVELRDGSVVLSDAGWKCWTGSTPPNDGAGHAWTDPAYDDHAWSTPTASAPYPTAPWKTQAGLSMMTGAAWIWPGQLAKGVSPVWFRRTFAPAATARN